jgi:hypothetical protein
LLNDKSLTEDYALGIRVGLRRIQARFFLVLFVGADGRREFIATREYFPEGIFPGRFDKSPGGLSESRCRVGGTFVGQAIYRPVISSFVTARASLQTLQPLPGYALIPAAFHYHWLAGPWIRVLSVLALNRVAQMLCVHRIYGWKSAAMCSASLARCVHGECGRILACDRAGSPESLVW